MTCPTCGTDHHAHETGEDVIAEAIETAAEIEAQADVAIAEEVSERDECHEDAATERNADDNEAAVEIAEINAEAAVEIAEAQAEAAVEIAQAETEAMVEIMAEHAEPDGDEAVVVTEAGEVADAVEEGEISEGEPVAVTVPPQLADEPVEPAAQPSRSRTAWQRRRGY